MATRITSRRVRRPRAPIPQPRHAPTLHTDAEVDAVVERVIQYLTNAGVGYRVYRRPADWKPRSRTSMIELAVPIDVAELINKYWDGA